MANNENLKSRTITSLLWRCFEKFGSQLITLIVSIVLARILDPADYGLVAITTVFVTIGLVFVECGFGTALVQKENITQKDIYTVFYSSLLISVVLFGVLFVSAPFIASFYHQPQLTPLLRVLGLILIFGSVVAVLSALLQRELKFRTLFIVNMIGTVASGAAGIIAAKLGAGAWALVLQQLMSRVVTGILLTIMLKWKPRLIYSRESFKRLFPFAFRILLARLIATVFQQIRSLIIGKQYNAEQLAFYNKGDQFPNMLATSTDYSFQNVMLSTYSKTQGDIPTLKRYVKISMKLSAYVLFPLMLGLCAVAKPLIIVLLGSKWLDCVPFLQIACFTYVLQPISTANLQAINAVGRSDITLKLEIITRTVAVLLIAGSVFIGIYAIAISAVVVSFFNTIVRAFPNKKLLNYGYFEQIGDLLPSLLLALVMGAAVMGIGCLKFTVFIGSHNVSVYLMLMLQVIAGIVIYVGLSWLFKFESFTYLLNTLKGFISRNKKKPASTGAHPE